MAVTTSWANQTEMNRSLEKKFEREGEIKKAIQIQIWIKWEKSIGAEFRRSTFLFNLKIGHSEKNRLLLEEETKLGLNVAFGGARTFKYRMN